MFWKHKSNGNISQLETRPQIGWLARSTNQRHGFQLTNASKTLAHDPALKQGIGLDLFTNIFLLSKKFQHHLASPCDVYLLLYSVNKNLLIHLYLVLFLWFHGNSTPCTFGETCCGCVCCLNFFKYYPPRSLFSLKMHLAQINGCNNNSTFKRIKKWHFWAWKTNEKRHSPTSILNNRCRKGLRTWSRQIKA